MIFVLIITINLKYLILILKEEIHHLLTHVKRSYSNFFIILINTGKE